MGPHKLPWDEIEHIKVSHCQACKHNPAKFGQSSRLVKALKDFIRVRTKRRDAEKEPGCLAYASTAGSFSFKV